MQVYNHTKDNSTFNLLFYFLGFGIIAPLLVGLVESLLGIQPTILSQLFISISCALILMIVNKDVFKEGKCRIGWGIAGAIAIYILQVVVAVLFANFIAPLFPQTSNTNQAMIDTAKNSYELLTLFATCVVIPIMEEIVFRYSITKYLRKYIKTEGIVFAISVFIFAFMHCGAGLESGNWWELANIVQYIVPAVILQGLFCKTNSIQTSCIAHMLSNFIILL